MTKQDPEEGGNHDETGSSRRVAKGDVHGNKPRNHEGTGSTKRETNGDTHGEKPGKRDETGSSRREIHMERSLEIMRELD